jgi:hypothetical protein
MDRAVSRGSQPLEDFAMMPDLPNVVEIIGTALYALVGLILLTGVASGMYTVRK